MNTATLPSARPGRHRARVLGVLGSIALLCLPAAAPAADEAALQVGFLAGGNKENNFWVRMGEFAEAVAEDLNIDLKITYPPPSTYVIKRKGEQLVTSLPNEAYFIMPYFDSVSGDLLKIAEERSIRSFVINTEILEQDRENIGVPRQKYRYWIGHMRPDDVLAGYLVADELMKRFEKPATVRMIGLNGDPAVQVAADRQAGLEKRLGESPAAKLLDVGKADWIQESARVTAQDLFKKHPEANAVWAASDPMALGAIEAIKNLGKQPGKDVIIASIDWTNEGLTAVQAGEMTANIGGHFMEAGIALLLIYDYHNQHDFVTELDRNFRTSMYSVSSENIDEYFRRVGKNPDWSSIDFKQFTKTHNPELSRYDFSWEAISSQLK